MKRHFYSCENAGENHQQHAPSTPHMRKAGLKFIMSTYSCIQSAAWEKMRKRRDSTWKESYTINSRARVHSIFSVQRLSQAKRMIAPPWQNINRVKISQWFRELYSFHRFETITQALHNCVFIQTKHMDESYSGLVWWAEAFTWWPVLWSWHFFSSSTQHWSFTEWRKSCVALWHIISHNLILACAHTQAFPSKCQAAFSRIPLSTL